MKWINCKVGGTLTNQSNNLSPTTFKSKRSEFLKDSYNTKLHEKHSKLLACCRPELTIDPILWLPTTCVEKERCLRWWLGWLPLGRPQPCPFHPFEMFNKRHIIQCLQMHNRLFLPQTIEDPLSFLLNKLPRKTKRIPKLSIAAWLICWPAICSILHEMDYLAHNQIPVPAQNPGNFFVQQFSSIAYKF